MLIDTCHVQNLVEVFLVLCVGIPRSNGLVPRWHAAKPHYHFREINQVRRPFQEVE